MRILAGTAMCVAVLIAASCHMQQSGGTNATPRTLSLNPTPTPSPGQEPAHKIFTVTENDLRKAFDDYEGKGEKKDPVSLGQKQSVTVSAQSPLGGSESLKLTVLFLSPVDQARAKGYQLGLIAKTRPPEELKALEASAISAIMKNINQVAFRVWLDQPKDANTTIPSISYELVDKDGNRVNPAEQPGSYLFGGKDIIGDVGLAQDALPLVFPLFNGSVANLTNKTDKMLLVVKIDSDERTLQFKLQ